MTSSTWISGRELASGMSSTSKTALPVNAMVILWPTPNLTSLFLEETSGINPSMIAGSSTSSNLPLPGSRSNARENYPKPESIIQLPYAVLGQLEA